MTDTKEILRLLQIAGGNFPIGGFSQSYGLETYIADKTIKSVEELKELLETYIKNIYCRSELPILRAAFFAAACSDYKRLKWLNEIAIATKLTKESRDASCKSGRAMLRIGTELVDSDEVREFFEWTRSAGAAFNIAFPVVACKLGISPESTASSYLFNGVNGLVQAAVKLMPLGNIEGQQLLQELMPVMEEAVKESRRISVNEISNFAPSIDMASIEHEVLKTRLYMS
ncbi:MAG: urease accessory protein UreF [Bacillota bacterium]|nr:urease accessory protein UreF [Bacillota bacterium]